MKRRRDGFLLVVVLIVVAMLSLAGFTFAEWMVTERQSTALLGREAQSRAAAESGLELAAAFIEQPSAAREADGGLYDNPLRFRDVPLERTDGTAAAYFCLIAPPEPVANSAAGAVEVPSLRFGLSDESTRLHLSALLEWEKTSPGAGRRALLQLPGMTESAADALLDWLDGDTQSREMGAEQEYYSQLQPAYASRNRLPPALDELLMVRGFTRDAFFGLDRNRNGRADAVELASGDAALAGAMAETSLRGWCDYLTIASAERNLAADGTPRINLNDEHLATLYVRLNNAFDEALARIVIAYRQAGPYSGSLPATAQAEGSLNLSAPGKFTFKSVLDLIDLRVQISFQNRPQPAILASPLTSDAAQMAEKLPELVDRLTVDPAPRRVGRINVNRASREVLLAVPGMEAALADEILSKRPAAGEPLPASHRHSVWLLCERVVELPKMKELLPFLTGGGDVYRVQVVAYGDRPGPPVRIEAVLDATSRPAQLVSWKDLQTLGPGYTLAQLRDPQRMREGGTAAGHTLAGRR